MRNSMQEKNVSDWSIRLARYVPQSSQETEDQREILSAIKEDGDAVLTRVREQGHITCSGFVMDPTMNAVLMVYHRIYDSFAWTGGHADGSNDFLAVSIREVKEETGVKKPFPLAGEILSLDILPVKPHQKHRKPVPAHAHYNITYGIIVSPKETLSIKPDENTDVRWIPVTEIAAHCKESHMLPVYEKLIVRMRELRQKQDACIQRIAVPLLKWYPDHARDLPWRRTKEPYHVWLSEIMLQQTRVEAVKGYYERFLTAFPDVFSLANATQDQVNKYWEGLGYYSRAANLRKAAIEIVTNHNGKFPRTWEEIRALPGIGDYTAGAIYSICFSGKTPAVDGNVLRVAARVTDCFCEIDRPAMKVAITQALTVQYHANPTQCDTLTQALMELGATVCLPNGTPHCESCPLESFCMAHQNRDEMRLPQRVEKKKRRMESYTVFLLCCDGAYAVRKRTAKGLLHGLWEFPNIPGICDESAAIAQARAWQCQPTDLTQTVEKQHIFTHVEWKLFGVYLTCAHRSPDFVWKTKEEIATEISLPTAFRQFHLHGEISSDES